MAAASYNWPSTVSTNNTAYHASLRGPSSIITPSSLPAVSRSAEWWSCVRTAVKIAQSTNTIKSAEANEPQQQLPWWVGWNPPVQLPAAASLERGDLWQLQEDGLSLLRGMQAELQKLQSLVRRRGHTNDPTQDIAHSVRQLELDAQELSVLIQQQQQQQRHGRYSAHYQRHVALVAQWLQQAASQQASQLKEILQVRANVLAEQAQQRRKLLKTNTNTKATNGAQHHDNHHAANNNDSKSMTSPRSGNSSAAFQSPLFTTTPQSFKNSQKRNNRLTTSSSSVSSTSAPINSHPAGPLYGNGDSEASSTVPAQPKIHSAPSSNGYVSSSTTSSYSYSGGGGYGGSSTMGMRQRKAAAATLRAEDSATGSHANGSGGQQEEWVVQEQIQERQKQRQTQYRVEAARQAERTLSELSTLFGKMSMLITQQGETLQKVEDDVESALLDVTDGQAELQVLHGIKRGNRSLILKVFGLLIFFIIFMRLYTKR